ncbi:uncharacterized protein [Centroberyx affinis]|uniref:uncharacterized protein n=1 Tax=Centroberyx affinis TaxID=166261 RepID=UPI003A5C2A35
MFLPTNCLCITRTHREMKCLQLGTVHTLLFATLTLALSLETQGWTAPGFCHGYDCPQFTAVQINQDTEERAYTASRWITTKVPSAETEDVKAGNYKLYNYCKGDNEEAATRSCRFSLYNIRKIRPFLMREAVLGRHWYSSTEQYIRLPLPICNLWSGPKPSPRSLRSSTLAGRLAPASLRTDVPMNTWPVLVAMTVGEDGSESNVSVSWFVSADTVLPKPADLSWKSVKSTGLIHKDNTKQLRQALVQAGKSFEPHRYTGAVYDSPWDIIHTHHNEIWVYAA